MIHYVPIDIPKLEYPSTLNYEGFEKRGTPYEGYHLSAFHENSWQPLALKNWNWAKEFIEEYLPITKFHIVRISTQQLSPIAKHFDTSGINMPGKPLYNIELVDHYNSITSPYGYRLVLTGKSNTVIIHNSKSEIDAILPDSTNCYCLNSLNTLHSAKIDNNRLVIFIQGWLDEKKHVEIINRSLLKYKDYIIAF